MGKSCAIVGWFGSFIFLRTALVHLSRNFVGNIGKICRKSTYCFQLHPESRTGNRSRWFLFLITWYEMTLTIIVFSFIGCGLPKNWPIHQLIRSIYNFNFGLPRACVYRDSNLLGRRFWAFSLVNDQKCYHYHNQFHMHYFGNSKCFGADL